MSIITQPVVVVNVVTEADGLDIAHWWGREDALSGAPRRPSQYFPFDTPQYAAYDAGYLAGACDLAQMTGRPVMVAMNTGNVMVYPAELPAEFAGALFDMEQGISYVAPGIDWEAVEMDRIGD